MPLSQVLAFVGADVIPMSGSEPPLLRAQTVLIEDHCIAALGPAAQVAVPATARYIDTWGKTLLPGLCDMHVHLLPTAAKTYPDGDSEEEAFANARQYLAAFLDSGVTTVRNMGGTPFPLALRQQLQDGVFPGPRVFTAGPILETRFTFPELASIGRLVRSPGEARAVVLEQKDKGYDFVKVYNDIDEDVYDEIVRVSREVEFPVAGHVPFGKGLDGALQARQASIEHLRSYDFAVDTRTSPYPCERFVGWLHTTRERITEVATRTAIAGVWNVPTLVAENCVRVEENVDPSFELNQVAQRLPYWLASALAECGSQTSFSARQRADLRAGIPVRLEMVAALDRAGAPLMAGSDCPNGGLAPGRSLLGELELFVAAGLSPQRAVRAATRDAAQFLGCESTTGSIAAGKRADLLLLEANPLEDIRALYRQTGVCVNGHWMTKADIGKCLGECANA